ncbi:hypothetical protein BSKO_10510 [Bryopsis sp. KO-2023]|nr:hypothetical protein BSKO_10510 [Bryopsis sp. KO-2023]
MGSLTRSQRFRIPQRLAWLLLLVAWFQSEEISAYTRMGRGLIRVGGYTTLGKNNGGEGFQVSFVDKNCRPFVFSAWNSWEIIEAAYGKASALPKGQQTKEQGRELVKWIFTEGKSAGMLVVRFFGHGWDQKMAFQTKPGEYNEEALKAMDWVLAEARRQKLKVVMTFADNWKEQDSRTRYAEMAGKDPMEFYTDDQIKTWFKNNMKVIVNRRNTETGELYKHDPTIMAWDLINEPRCDCNIAEGGPNCDLECADRVNAWIHEMADFLKQEDPFHMVVVGEEGFYSRTHTKRWVNPDAYSDGGSPWAERAGQDYVMNHGTPAIDYLGIHVWADNWGLPEKWFQESWVKEHKDDGWFLVKPVVLEEFGKTVYTDDESDRVTRRDPFLVPVYDMLKKEVKWRGPMQGVGFWEFDAAGGAGKSPGPYGIRPEHSTWKDVIHPNSWTIDWLGRHKPLESHCLPGEVRSMDAVFYQEFVGEGADETSDDDVFYSTHGHHLDTVETGMELKHKKGLALFDAMRECENTRGCFSFRYKPNSNDKNKGEARFYRRSNRKDFKWSSEGWQVFFKDKAYRNCYDPDCKFCTDKGVCIKCENGPLWWDDDSDTPQCKKPDQVEAENLQKFEFGMPVPYSEEIDIPIPPVSTTPPPTLQSIAFASY